ncbi:MAG: 50S ribosomal protein L2 [Proteobacteria bacterium]|nr:50S ribosomal protein L2 [Pseudomonadota bacterium]MDA0896033.1 50S ribosomal protein L2 [Pseudomonadota bacterium]MDA1243835.1 50S ribosomal protein L2 [Pseudomonadota bacterium]
MPVVKCKPTSPGRRHVIKIVHDDLHKGAPYAPLTAPKSKTGGRNNLGRITRRHAGGGHKQKYRIIDFKRNRDGIPAKVERLEYDPNRSALIALLLYADGVRTYIIAPNKVKTGDTLVSGDDAAIKVGNCLPLRNVPLGSTVHCVELKPGKGAQVARSAGTSLQLVAREGAYATLRLRSGEMRKVLSDCRAVLGEVSNSEHSLRQLGKAGAKRWRGVRPTVRGVAMNPVDHPHGGGEGRTSGGRHPVSPWGMPTKGYKTRSNKRTDSMIVRRRNSSR